ncbi:MAG TPA: arginyltransferase [Solimonas sp.]|nr:arginyltransferase [Solimonas sp.]
MTAAQPVRLFLSPEHPCGYLPFRTARSAFVDPEFTLAPPRYQRLLELGFRRSGEHAYRPHCRGCERCLPVRVPTARFQPDRSQRRCIRDNADLELRLETQIRDEHYALYRRYLAARHAGGGMDPDDRTAFHNFLECGWNEVRYWSFREQGRLLAVAVVDHLPRALSAVYTFFDPAESRRGLGTLAVLRQIEEARRQGLPHVYLGYWVEGSAKMDYKRRFQPLEILEGTDWVEIGPG